MWLKMEAVGSFEALVPNYITTWRYTPEDQQILPHAEESQISNLHKFLATGQHFLTVLV